MLLIAWNPLKQDADEPGRSRYGCHGVGKDERVYDGRVKSEAAVSHSIKCAPLKMKQLF